MLFRLAKSGDPSHLAEMTEDPATLFVKSLGEEISVPDWPVGVRLVAFDEMRHPAACHRLLAQGYAEGQGEVPAFDRWWSDLRADSEYSPERTFVAVDEAHEPIAFAQCWTSGFVKDLAVARHWRRRGVGRALLANVFEAFRLDGFDTVRLKVRADNDAAIALYRSMRMIPVT